MRVTQKPEERGGIKFFRLSRKCSPIFVRKFICGDTIARTCLQYIPLWAFFPFTFCRCCCRFWNVTRCDKDNDDSDANDDDGNVASAMYKIRTIAICNKNMQFFVIVMCGFYRTLTQIRAATHTQAHPHTHMPLAHTSWHMPRAPV